MVQKTKHTYNIEAESIYDTHNYNARVVNPSSTNATPLTLPSTSPTSSTSSSSSSSSAVVSHSSSSSTAASSSSASSLSISSSTSPMHNMSSYTYICIITDMTDASNTCKRRAINLSSTYTIDNLMQEAANFYAYDPFSFVLMWKCGNEMINISEFQGLMTLGDLGLTTQAKNMFEIHEKEGPPKRIKIDAFAQDQTPDYMSSCGWQTGSGSVIPMSTINRRNAVSNDNDNDNNTIYEYGPVNNVNATFSERDVIHSGVYASPSSATLTGSSSNFNNDEDVGYVGLINQAMTCYLNSLLQTLYMTPEFRNGIYRWKFNELLNGEDDGKKSIPFQLQRLFLNLQTSNKKSIQTSDLTKSFGWNSDDAFQQHDVQELCRVMFDALEKNFKGTEQENLINELYQGKIKDYVKCLECNIESARVNVFLDISLCLRPFGSEKTYESVEEALDAFVQPEILDENNKYFCDKCQRMCKAHKGLKFESFPYIISLQLNRFDFDYSTMSRVKISNTVSFPETLNIKKYLKKTKSLSQSQDNDEEIKKDDEEEEDQSKFDYELFSIMIHSGSATGGHYYAYIKCFETDQWLNFNDERVSKLDKRDIKKAFGTSFSMYSSTTAYMLLYRQKQPQRNEKFIKLDEFNDYLKQLLIKEKNQQLEADRLKEYMDNSCKIKVLVPSINENENSDLVGTKREKTVNLHKDLTLDQAKQELIKEFNLSDYLNSSNKQCRILKYDTYNDLIEESYKNESVNTVFEILGFTKYPYGYCWYLEILPSDQKFIDYNSSDFNIKVINLNMITFETNDLFNLRLKNNSTINELRNQIAEKLNVDPSLIRMALEKPHTLCSYAYLNKNLNDTLKSQHFGRVNKVFIEFQDEFDLNKDPECSKFFYALEAIMNMLQMIVYLPVDEQCDIFMRKIQRRNFYIENQRNMLRRKQPPQSNSTHIELHQQISQNSSSSLSDLNLRNNNSFNNTTLVNENENYFSNESQLSPINNDSVSIKTPIQELGISTIENENSDTKMSEQQLVNDSQDCQAKLNLIEDHFKHENNAKMKKIDPNFNEMETSLDEGIGSSGSMSNNNAKNSPNSDVNIKSSTFFFQTLEQNAQNSDAQDSINEQLRGDARLLAFKFAQTPFTNNKKKNNSNEDTVFNSENIDLDQINIEAGDEDIDECEDTTDLDVNVDDNEINNIDDDFNDETNSNNNLNSNLRINEDFNDEDDLDDGLKLSKENINLNDDYFSYQEDDLSCASMPSSTKSKLNLITDDDTNSKSTISKEFKSNRPRSVKFFNQTEEILTSDSNLDEHFPIDVSDSQNAIKPPFITNQNVASSMLTTLDQNTHDNYLKIVDALNKHDDNSNITNDSNSNNNEELKDNIDHLPHYSELKLNDYTKESTEDNQMPNENRFIKSNLIVNPEMGAGTLEIRMDKRIDLNDFKSHINEYLKIGNENFRVFRMCPNDLECELSAYENQFAYLTQNTKFVIKLGPPLKYGEYVIPVFKLNTVKGTISYLCDFTVVNSLSVLNHKELLREDLKDECNLDIPVEKMRLRKKQLKKPGEILLNNQIFGLDIFINSTSELCVQILDEPEKKEHKNQTYIFLRHWKPDEYELSELKEVFIDGNSYESLIETISSISEIPINQIEVLKCKRDFPYKSPILDLHKDSAWRDNYSLHTEKLEDGFCFYFRNKTLKLGEITEEKRREMAKEDNLNFRPTLSFSIKKEIGIKIHVENSN